MKFTKGYVSSYVVKSILSGQLSVFLHTMGNETNQYCSDTCTLREILWDWMTMYRDFCAVSFV